MKTSQGLENKYGTMANYFNYSQREERKEYLLRLKRHAANKKKYGLGWVRDPDIILKAVEEELTQISRLTHQ